MTVNTADDIADEAANDKIDTANDTNGTADDS